MFFNVTLFEQFQQYKEIFYRIKIKGEKIGIIDKFLSKLFYLETLQFRQSK